MSNQNPTNPMTPPPAAPINYDILPEGMNIISTGFITSQKQYYDLVEGHKRDGYTHHIRCPHQMDRWYEVALISRVITTDNNQTVQKGAVLIFYCGTAASFKAWQQEFMLKIEQQAIAKMSGRVQ